MQLHDLRWQASMIANNTWNLKPNTTTGSRILPGYLTPPGPALRNPAIRNPVLVLLGPEISELKKSETLVKTSGWAQDRQNTVQIPSQYRPDSVPTLFRFRPRKNIKSQRRSKRRGLSQGAAAPLPSQTLAQPLGSTLFSLIFLGFWYSL